MSNGIGVTAEMVRAVSVYVRLVSDAIFWGGVARPHRIEHKFHLAAIDPELFGTNDAIVRDGYTLRVYDLKYGAGVAVSPAGNPQLLYYALGALLDAELCRGVETVELVIVQPRGAGAVIKSHTVDVLEVAEFGVALAAAVARTRAPDAPLVAGSHCKFCPVAATCPANGQAAFAAAGAAFADMAPLTLPKPSGMSAEELGLRLQQAAQLRLWLKALEKHALTEGLAGRPPVGMKVVAGHGTRVWRGDPDAALRSLCEMTDLRREDVFREEPISVAQAEALLGKKEFEAFLSLVERKPGKPTLAPTTDKRPEIDLAKSFDDVT